MKSILFALSLLLLTATLNAQVGKPAPAFSLKDKDGKTFSLETLKGKVIVLNFWATWCPPCRVEIPAFNNAYEKYVAKGVEIVGVSGLSSRSIKSTTPSYSAVRKSPGHMVTYDPSPPRSS